MRWSDVAARCKAAGLSHGELCRRAGLSESAMNKGLRRDSKLSGATLRQVDLVLSVIEAVDGRAA